VLYLVGLLLLCRVPILQGSFNALNLAELHSYFTEVCLVLQAKCIHKAARGAGLLQWCVGYSKRLLEGLSHARNHLVRNMMGTDPVAEFWAQKHLRAELCCHLQIVVDASLY
jgi:hypothetical protein